MLLPIADTNKLALLSSRISQIQSFKTAIIREKNQIYNRIKKHCHLFNESDRKITLCHSLLKSPQLPWMITISYFKYTQTHNCYYPRSQAPNAKTSAAKLLGAGTNTFFVF